MTQLDKHQPQATELEQAVLGAMMLDKNAVIDALEILIPDSFYSDANRMIYEAILALSKANTPIDILTVTNALKIAGKLESVGGAYYISQLTNNIASSANVQYHSRIIEEKRLLRDFLSLFSKMQSELYVCEDPFLIDEKLSIGHSQVMGGVSSSTIKHIKEAMVDVNNAIDKGEQNHGLTGITSGLTELDRITGGWQKSDLIIVAARTAMGKSALMMTLARNAAKSNEVLVFSKEMSTNQLAKRLVSLESEISSEILYRGRLDSEQRKVKDEAIKTIEGLKITVDDNSGMTTQAIKTASVKHKKKHGLGLVLVDYIQIINVLDAKGKSRNDIVGEITAELKNIARLLDVPVIALAQVGRSAEKRGGDMRPMLADLRESGNLEMEANVVIFIHRPEYYGITTYEDGNSTAGIAELIVAKNRDGALDTVRVGYNASCTKFHNLPLFGFQHQPIKPNNHFEVEAEDDNLTF
jgi:replicative DNA helicase